VAAGLPPWAQGGQPRAHAHETLRHEFALHLGIVSGQNLLPDLFRRTHRMAFAFSLRIAAAAAIIGAATWGTAFA
jgi:hypothetical protein